MSVPTHAGGIVFRGKGDDVAYLVVQARANPAHWLFPKGHIEDGETDEAAAAREVAEEAGVAAEVGTTTFIHGSETVRTRYFLMRYDGEVEPEESRERRWCGFAEAQSMLSFEDIRRLLTAADALRQSRQDL